MCHPTSQELAKIRGIPGYDQGLMDTDMRPGEPDGELDNVFE